jgi:outer membrane protein assembly factor BamB
MHTNVLHTKGPLPCTWIKRGTIARLFLLSIAAPLVWPVAGMDISHLWTANSHMVMEGAPMVVDLNGDGDEEILTAAYQSIIALDGTGKELWRFDTRARFSTCPAILECEGRPPLIYAGDNRGMFVCLDASGKVVWKAETAPVFCASPAIADLNGDGKAMVIQGDKSGAVNVFDALSGTLLWKKTIDGECTSPAAGDLDGDGLLEVVIATGAGKVFALNASGESVWEFNAGGTTPDWATSSPILFENSKGKVCVAAASSQERFFCLDGQGKVLWERPTRGSVDSSISSGDLDLDGRAELFAVTQLGVLYRFDENGRVQWEIDTQGRSLAPGATIDLDGNGSLEYMLCTQNGNLLVFNHTGEVVFNHTFKNRTINMTAAFGEILKERPGIEFAVTGGESGQVFCFGTPAPVKTTAQWRTYRSDNRLSGAWLGLSRADERRMSPVNLSWDQIYTGDSVEFQVTNPNPGDAPLRAEASCLRPDGSRQAATGLIVGKRGVLSLPVTITAPGVYRFDWALVDHSGDKCARGARELTLDPYRNDQALAKRALLALNEAVGQEKPVEVHPGLRASMHQESLAIEKDAIALAVLQAAAPGSSPAFGEELEAQTAALGARAMRALALANAAPGILAGPSDCEVIAFEGTTWENREVNKQFPSEASIPLRLTRRCVPDEHEPVSIKVFNVTTQPVRVSAQVEKSSGGFSATVCEVKPVKTNLNTLAWDPIVPLGIGQVEIPSLETRELWLDVDLAGTPPGPHQAVVTLSTGRFKTTAEVSLEVLPFRMAGFGSMRLCCWADYKGDAVKDLLAHGNTVFTAGLPSANIIESGTPLIKIDYTELDRFLDQLSGHDVFLLMTGIPKLGVPVVEAAYVPRLADYLEQVMSHLAGKGISEDRVALYPHDEPGVVGWDVVNDYVAFGRQGLKARPGLKFYVNGGGDLPMFEKLDEVAAIWSPSYYVLPDDTPEMRFIRGSGKTLWSYDCAYCYSRPIGANTKATNVAGQYRLSPVFGFNSGATGIGFWCYNNGPSMWDPIPLEYPLVYANPDGTHTACRRWEAVREGMEDARILIALREKLSSDAVSEAVKARIRHLLGQTLPEIANQSLEEVRLGVARYVLDTTNNDATVGQLRGEMMECVALIRD